MLTLPTFVVAMAFTALVNGQVGHGSRPLIMRRDAPPSITTGPAGPTPTHNSTMSGLLFYVFSLKPNATSSSSYSATSSHTNSAFSSTITSSLVISSSTLQTLSSATISSEEQTLSAAMSTYGEKSTAVLSSTWPPQSRTIESSNSLTTAGQPSPTQYTPSVSSSSLSSGGIATSGLSSGITQSDNPSSLPVLSSYVLSSSESTAEFETTASSSETTKTGAQISSAEIRSSENYRTHTAAVISRTSTNSDIISEGNTNQVSASSNSQAYSSTMAGTATQMTQLSGSEPTVSQSHILSSTGTNTQIAVTLSSLPLQPGTMESRYSQSSGTGTGPITVNTVIPSSQVDSTGRYSNTVGRNESLSSTSQVYLPTSTETGAQESAAVASSSFETRTIYTSPIISSSQASGSAPISITPLSISVRATIHSSYTDSGSPSFSSSGSESQPIQTYSVLSSLATTSMTISQDKSQSHSYQNTGTSSISLSLPGATSPSTISTRAVSTQELSQSSSSYVSVTIASSTSSATISIPTLLVLGDNNFGVSSIYFSPGAGLLSVIGPFVSSVEICLAFCASLSCQFAGVQDLG